jgi:hypothetical protein
MSARLSVLMVAAMGLIPSLCGPVLANKPLVGVACGGGFFVRAPTQKIYWIHGDPLEKTVVHDGADKLMALAECGNGTVAVFQDAADASHSRTFFSSDCRNIGQATGNTRLVHDAIEPVASLTVDEGRLVIGMASGASHASAICLNH